MNRHYLVLTIQPISVLVVINLVEGRRIEISGLEVLTRMEIVSPKTVASAGVLHKSVCNVILYALTRA